MKPTVCRVCGGRFATAAFDNPNICLACAATDWSEPDSWQFREGLHGDGGEMDHLLNLERPTAIECVNAEEDAIMAIFESTAVEENCGAPKTHSLVRQQRASPKEPSALAPQSA